MMTITADNFLSPALRDLITGGSDMAIRRCLVWHFTGGATAKSSIQAMRERGVSAHVVVDRDGTIYQCRRFNLTAGHAGESRWLDPTCNKVRSGVNNFGIGIEIANAGDDPDALAWTKAHGGRTAMATHWQGGPVKEWEIYPDAQLRAVLTLSQVLKKAYNLDDATGHEYIAPERKNDPGPLFPMQEFREALGFVGLPHINRL